MWMFSGMRKEEIGRVTWEQVEQGLVSGSIYLLGSQSKTGDARAVPLADNLKEWLSRYRRPSGLVLPLRWHGTNETHRLQRLDDLTGHFARRLGSWVSNGPRHSFATYHLALFKDAANTVRQMGTSLAKLEKHYWARAENVTTDQARDWFSIRPEDSSNVVSLRQERPLAERIDAR